MFGAARQRSWILRIGKALFAALAMYWVSTLFLKSVTKGDLPRKRESRRTKQ